MRHQLLISARSILFGWIALFAAIYLVVRPLLLLTARLLGASWFPTAQLALACAGLAATGWIVGHGNRFDVLIFAAMLAIWNFGLVPVDIPWLLRLLIDTFGSSRYLESFSTSLATHAFLFVSLFIGSHLARAKLNRAREQAALRIK
jgi:hypothetical protein